VMWNNILTEENKLTVNFAKASSLVISVSSWELSYHRQEKKLD